MRQRVIGYSGDLDDPLPREPVALDTAPFAQATTAFIPRLTAFLQRAPLLTAACLLCGLLISYQLVVTWLQPPWIKPATDWLSVVTAWLELALVVWLSLRFTRARRPGATSWWMLSVALLLHAVSRTCWVVDDLFVFPLGVPFPQIPDIVLVLQYPFFFLAVVMLPCIHPWVPRLRVILDALLWMGTATALSWYFILKDIPIGPGGSVVGSITGLADPIGDLVVFFGLAVAVTRPSRSLGDRWALYILSAAFMCLFAADTLVVVLLRNSEHTYMTGEPPDLFWMAFYALVPLAGLVQLRLVRHERPQYQRLASERLRWRDVLISVRALIPFTATLVASALIMLDGNPSPADGGILSMPISRRTVGLGLLLLATVRQVIVSLEYEQLRRAQESARAHETALMEANRRMEEFLGIVSHELKTPLTSLSGNIQLMAQRLDAPAPAEAGPEDQARALVRVRTLVQNCESSLCRIDRLVNDLLDDALIREGRLDVVVSPCNLIAVVNEAIEEQRLLAPTRTIQWRGADPQAMQPIAIFADTHRLMQVVGNYVSNALKYSRDDQPVEVSVRVVGRMGCVWVRDTGVGVPFTEQEEIWSRFHRAAGVAIQSGSDVGLGIGLHISKTIVERHGGQVGLQSVPGQGSTFWFTMPLADTPSTTCDRDHMLTELRKNYSDSCNACDT